jgi:hypothetical protein
MKRIFIFIFSLIALYTQAQTITVKQPNGTETLFTRLDSAIIQSPSGATYFLSGDVFNNIPNPLNINKQVTIIGQGFDSDSTSFYHTSVTNLNVNLQILDGSDNSVFKGFSCNDINFTNPSNGNLKVKNITIQRVKFYTINMPPNPYNTWNNPNISNILISECEFHIGNFSRCSNLLIQNCLIGWYIIEISNASITNNIFIYNYSWNGNPSINGPYGSTIKNNIFRNSYISNGSSGGNTSFQNNLFLGYSNLPTIQGAIMSGNLVTIQQPSDIFVDYQSTYTKNDYHIKPNTIAKNAGTDGKDLGIHGGSGFRGTPPIPWIESKNVGQQTNAQGQLPVYFRVKAKQN